MSNRNPRHHFEHSNEVANKCFYSWRRLLQSMTLLTFALPASESLPAFTSQIVTCKECKYTFWAPHERCRALQHHLMWKNTKKRFFQCTNCKSRTVTWDCYPTKACRCGLLPISIFLMQTRNCVKCLLKR